MTVDFEETYSDQMENILFNSFDGEASEDYRDWIETFVSGGVSEGFMENHTTAKALGGADGTSLVFWLDAEKEIQSFWIADQKTGASCAVSFYINYQENDVVEPKFSNDVKAEAGSAKAAVVQEIIKSAGALTAPRNLFKALSDEFKAGLSDKDNVSLRYGLTEEPWREWKRRRIPKHLRIRQLRQIRRTLLPPQIRLRRQTRPPPRQLPPLPPPRTAKAGPEREIPPTSPSG